MFFLQPLHFVTHTLTNLIPLMPYTPSLGSNGPYSSILRIHFTTRMAPTTVRREHNNKVPKFRVNIDGETENTTLLSKLLMIKPLSPILLNKTILLMNPCMILVNSLTVLKKKLLKELFP